MARRANLLRSQEKNEAGESPRGGRRFAQEFFQGREQGLRIRQVRALAAGSHQAEAFAVSRAVGDAGVGAALDDLLIERFKWVQRGIPVGHV